MVQDISEDKNGVRNHTGKNGSGRLIPGQQVHLILEIHNRKRHEQSDKSASQIASNVSPKPIPYQSKIFLESKVGRLHVGEGTTRQRNIAGP